MTLDLANEPAIRLNHVRQTDREDGLLSSSAYHRIIRIIIGEIVVARSFKIQEVVTAWKYRL